MSSGREELPCREQSLAASEPLAGTAASGVEHWLVLELRGVWERKLLDCPALGDVRPLLESWEREHPKLRLQLIRRPEVHDLASPLQLFVVTASLQRQLVLEGRVESPRELEELDLGAILGEGRDPAGRLRERPGPLYLVCGHGRRDRCCGRLGTPIYQRLRELAPEDCWQTSHTGGHRFAPTLIHLPSGLCYGRVELEECERLVAAGARDQVYDLERLRGRCCLRPAEQVAEIEVMRRDPEFRLRACASEADDSGAVAVHLEGAEGRSEQLQLRPEQRDDGIEVSCGSGKVKPVTVWQRA